MKHFPLLSFGKCYSLLLILILQPLFAVSQTFEITKAEITVHGNAREKPWSMTAQTAAGMTDLIFHKDKLVRVQSLKFSVNVVDLKSKNAKMDQRAHKALKAYPYNRIQFLGKVMKLKEVGTNSYMLLTEGNLNIGGITQIVSVLVNINVKNDGTLICSGTKEVKLNDFNVSLLPAEQRVMRLNNSVKINFLLTLTKASTENH